MKGPLPPRKRGGRWQLRNFFECSSCSLQLSFFYGQGLTVALCFDHNRFRSAGGRMKCFSLELFKMDEGALMLEMSVKHQQWKKFWPLHQMSMTDRGRITAALFLYLFVQISCRSDIFLSMLDTTRVFWKVVLQYRHHNYGHIFR